MQAINFMYSLFGLVLGLGISGILGNFAKAWRINAGVSATTVGVRIGWLVPLLGTLVIMDQTQFYMTAFELRNAVPFSNLSLLCVLAVVGVYFMVSTFIFPEAPADWPDFDDYYMRVKRIVAIGILGTNLALLVFGVLLIVNGHEMETTGQSTGIEQIASLLFLPLITALIFVKSKRANLILLALLNLAILVPAVSPVLT